MFSILLKFLNPEQIKKYGLYFFTSLFILISAFLLRDDISVRNRDTIYDRAKNDSLQVMLNDQYKLKTEQEGLLKVIKPILSDTIKTKNNEKH